LERLIVYDVGGYFNILKNRNAIDTTNFSQYPDSDDEALPIRPVNDPFLDIDWT
jgi:hypothetical protein